MAISDTDRAVIETSSGTIAESDLDAVEAALDRVGSPHVVGLERLMIRLRDYEMNTAVISSADDQLNHRNNVEWLRSSVRELAASITSLVASGDVTLTTAAELILAGVEGSRSYTAPLSVSYTAPRRG